MFCYVLECYAGFCYVLLPMCGRDCFLGLNSVHIKASSHQCNIIMMLAIIIGVGLGLLAGSEACVSVESTIPPPCRILTIKHTNTTPHPYLCAWPPNSSRFRTWMQSLLPPPWFCLTNKIHSTFRPGSRAVRVDSSPVRSPQPIRPLSPTQHSSFEKCYPPPHRSPTPASSRTLAPR